MRLQGGRRLRRFYLFILGFSTMDCFSSAGIDQSDDMKRFLWYVDLSPRLRRC